MELVVKIYNINKGHNPKLLGKSITLENYSVLVDKIREYEQEGNLLDKAVSLAVKYCIDNNVLRDFLKKHGSEVFNMLYSEYSFEEEAAVIREEAREEGREEGLEEGRVVGREEEREQNRQYFLELLNQGLTVEEIKQRLEQF
jgi:hypothetical protein